jgi:hypothetical protein
MEGTTPSGTRKLEERDERGVIVPERTLSTPTATAIPDSGPENTAKNLMDVKIFGSSGAGMRAGIWMKGCWRQQLKADFSTCPFPCLQPDAAPCLQGGMSLPSDEGMLRAEVPAEDGSGRLTRARTRTLSVARCANSSSPDVSCVSADASCRCAYSLICRRIICSGKAGQLQWACLMPVLRRHNQRYH